MFNFKSGDDVRKKFTKEELERVSLLIEKKRNVNVALTKDVYTNIQILLLKTGSKITLSKILTEVCERISMQENYMVKLIEQVIEDNKIKEKKQLCDIDSNDMFYILEKESPIIDDTK